MTPQEPSAPHKVCHRFMVPMPLMEQVPNPLDPRQPGMKPVPLMGYQPCVYQKCERWNNSLKMCNDNADSAALHEISLSLQKLVGSSNAGFRVVPGETKPLPPVTSNHPPVKNITESL